MEFSELPLSARVKKELLALAKADRSITETLPVIFHKSIDEKMSKPVKKSVANQNDLPFTRNKKKSFDRKVCLDLTEEQPDIIFERAVVDRASNPLKRLAEDQSDGSSEKLYLDLTEEQPVVISNKTVEKGMKENDKKREPIRRLADEQCDGPSSKVKKESSVKNAQLFQLCLDLTEEQPVVISNKSVENRMKENDKKREPIKRLSDEQCDGPSSKVKKESSVKKLCLDLTEEQTVVNKSGEKRMKENDKKREPIKRLADEQCDGPSSKVKKESSVKNEKNADLKLAAISEIKLSAMEKKISAIEKREFPKITAEMEKVIAKALGPGDPCEQFSAIGCFDLTRRDLQTLSADGWLNDQVINFYLAMIADRSKLENYPSVYTFNSYFYPSVSNRGNSVVSRWTKEADIFSYDLLFVPVHLGLHWALITVDHRSKSLLYYDSMDCRGKAYLKNVKDYLVAEMMDKKSQVLDPDSYSMNIAQDIPKQENGSDCGVFILKYAEYISRDAPITFSDIHMAYFRRRLVYELITKKIL